MSTDFVRYGPELETIDPHLDEPIRFSSASPDLGPDAQLGTPLGS